MSYLAKNLLIGHMLLLCAVVAPSRLSIAKETPGDDTQQPINRRLTPATQDAPIRVACIGDSITSGMGIKNRDHDSYPAILQRLLGDAYVVGNFGRSGADVLLVNNGPYARASEHRAALDFLPDIVICNLGINDHVLVASHQDAFVRDYTSLLEQYAALPTKPRLLIWTQLAPVMPGQPNHEQCERLRETFASLLEKVADQTGAHGIDMYAPLAGHPEWFPDHLHPSAQGAGEIAQISTHIVAQLDLADSTSPTTTGVPSDQGFEKAPLGEWHQLVTPIGRWLANPGHAEITDQNMRSGKQSLRIRGGKDRSIVFYASPKTPNNKVLSFWAERWTVQAPFHFRIEQRVQDQWIEIYQGDDQIEVGGFHTHVMVPVRDEKQVELRLSLTSPESSGLLVDDVELVDAKQMKATKATVDQPVLPALVGTEWSAITRLRIDVDGNSGEPPVVTAVDITTRGTTEPADIDNVQIFYTRDKSLVSASGNSNAFDEAVPFGTPQPPVERKQVRGKQNLVPGPNYFWIAYRLDTKANIDHRVNGEFLNVQLSGDHALPVQKTAKPQGQRMGVAVRRRGDDNVHTYRIPGLATTNKGTLIGVYDIRHRGGGDLPGDIDVGMSRSADGGRTWEPMKTIMDMGSDPQWKYDGIGDPAVLVDNASNTIWVAAVWSHGNRAWSGSQPGMTPEQTGQLMLVRSDDDGCSWSKPINMTKQVKKPEWCFLLQGPGKGITMQDGTLVFPAQYQDTESNGRLPRSTIIYSRDQGETWHIGTGAHDDTTEAQVVELEPGVLMLNCRYNREPRRVVAITHDMGRTWQEHQSSRQTLIEPHACMASLINIPYAGGDDQRPWLLFSNPHSLKQRERMTIQASGDTGQTWSARNQLLLDEAPSAGYSCMSMIDERTIGILYEGSQAQMTFQRVPLTEIIRK